MATTGPSPAEEMMAKAKASLPGVEILGHGGADILLGLYIRPEKTAGGIYLTDRQKDEDIYQGKIGLVLKLGPLAFQPDKEHKWGPRTPVVGDWVAFRVSDGWPFILGDMHCRMVEDVNIKMIVSAPDMVY